MIDLHNHILPDLDDGATDVVESLEIARTFVAEGVGIAVATPHVNPMRGTGPSRDEVHRAVELLQRDIDAAGIPLQVLPGCEILLTPEVPHLLQSGGLATLAEGTAILVELPFEQRPLYAESTLSSLVEMGYKPVLAHPERYRYFEKNPDDVLSVLSRGVTLQLTAPSFFGGYGSAVRRMAELLLREGAYGCAASDRHHASQQRSLRSLRERLNSLGDGLGDVLLQENPAALLHGDDVLPTQPVVGQTSFLSRLFGP